MQSNRLVIYYRESLFEEELEAALEAGFVCESRLTRLLPTDTVLLRYTTLPFAKDVHADLLTIGCKLVNGLSDHEFMADLFKWYKLLKDYTPKTYNQYQMAKLPEGSYVVKGCTNSKKAYWNTHMYAPNKASVGKIFGNLVDDSLIGNQEIAIREFVPLKTYMLGINDMPVTSEYRYFFFEDGIIARGFYWQNYADELDPEAIKNPEERFALKALLNVITDKMWDHMKVSFYCVDIAQTADGNWMIVEINDGTMAGLSCINPKEFYGNLYEELVNRYL